MKIKLINPDYGMTEAQLKERLAILSKAVSADTVLAMDCLHEHQVVIDSQLDVYLAAPEIIAQARAAEKEGFDGVILYCFSDPALAACREIVSIPVLGAGQCALLLAASLGYHFSLLITGGERIAEKKVFVQSVGIDASRLASVRPVDLVLGDIRHDEAETIAKLIAAGRQCIEADGAQVIVLGCLSFLGMAPAVSKALGVPVIDPALAALGFAEGVIRQGLSQSRKAYPKPPAGRRQYTAGAVEII